MAIYLSQHGKSASKDIDPERGLTPEGAAEVTRVAETLAKGGVTVDVIRHSGKTRAAQTADIFADSLNPKNGVESQAGIDPLDDVESFATALPMERHEMYVGHLPFMERLVSYLITGDSAGRVVAFQNGGVVRLDRDTEAKRWVIGWTAFPGL
jgi:phosphohistidine phosphatase